MSASRFAFTSPIWFAGHCWPASTLQYVWLHVPSVELPPAKWSFSSAVTTNSVFCFVMPSRGAG